MTKVVKSLLGVALAFVLALSLSACQTNNWGGKQMGGTLVGAGLGGLLGSQFGSGKGQLAATAVGVLLGAWVGNEVGASLDRADEQYARHAAHSALEHNRLGVSSAWNNPDSGHSGMVTPTRTYQGQAGEYCREYLQMVMVGGKQVQGYGTACRNPDGSWRIR